MQNVTSTAAATQTNTMLEARITERMEELRRLISEADDRFFSVIKALQKDAAKLTDDSLAGRAYYLCALACYVGEAYEQIFPNLQKSLYHLLRGDDHELLARAYNLFAVNAQRIGCHDVAYNYFMTAYSFVEDDPDSLVRAIIDANIGDLLAELGDYRKACTHIRRSIPVVNRHPEDVMYLQNLVTVTVNLGLYSLYDDNLPAAKKLLVKVGRQLEEAGDAAGEQTELWYRLFYAQIALAEKNRKELPALVDEVMTRIVSGPLFGSFMKDTHRFCRSLISAGEWTSAQALIDAIAKNDLSKASNYSRQLLTRAQIEFYKAVGNQKKLSETYAARHAIAAREQDEKKEVYRESTDLMMLVDELRNEQLRKRMENEALRRQAETDALTNLPNRYALNRALEEAYDRAQAGRYALGVGIVDVDDFKKFNDTAGHQAGDDCLRKVSYALRRVADKWGLYTARYGGDEFVLIYERMGEKRIQEIEKELLAEIPVGVTHGYYVAEPREEIKLWDYLTGADARMYQLKKKRGV